jgi:PAS domain S-box-containing protein
LGAFLVNITTQGSLLTVLDISVGNTLEGVCGAWLVNRFAGGRHALDHPHDVISFVVLAGMVSTVVSATIGVLSLIFGGVAPWEHFGAIWLTWWTGDLVGCIVVGSFLLLLANHFPLQWKKIQKNRIPEFILMIAAITTTGLFTFSDIVLDASKHYPIEFLCVPPLLWAAFRFGRTGASAATLILAGIAVWGTLNGFGPFATGSQNESLLLLQAFIGIVSVTMLVLGAALREQMLAQQARQQLASIVESSADAIIGKTLNGIITTWNKSAERLYGFTAREAIGQPITLVVPPGRLREIESILRRLRQSKKIKHFETKRLRKDGKIIDVALTVSPIKDDRGHVVGASTIAHDITERKKMEEEKDEFLSLVAHQLQTPIVELKLLIENMMRGFAGKLSSAQRAYLADMEQISTRNFHLMTDLLNSSQLDRGQLTFKHEPVPLRAVIDDAMEKYEHITLAKKLKLVRSPIPTVHVLADREKLVQALSNIIHNATKYTNKGSISIGVTVKKGNALISVRDTGIGITPKIQAKLFKRNQILSGKPIAGGGTGLGLYIAKKFMLAQHGNVTIASTRVGRGTTFVLRIPLAPV